MLLRDSKLPDFLSVCIQFRVLQPLYFLDIIRYFKMMAYIVNLNNTISVQYTQMYAILFVLNYLCWAPLGLLEL